jgi:hypothetical protein
MANKHRKVWKVVSRKMNSEKQTWPKVVGLGDARMSDLYELPCTSTYTKVCGSVIIIVFQNIFYFKIY